MIKNPPNVLSVGPVQPNDDTYIYINIHKYVPMVDKHTYIHINIYLYIYMYTDNYNVIKRETQCETTMH